MVQEDSCFAVIVALVSKSVFNSVLLSRCGAGKYILAHGNGNVAVEINLVVLELHFLPSLASIDSKTSIFVVALQIQDQNMTLNH